MRTQWIGSTLRKRWSSFSSAAKPARASSSDEEGSRCPSAFTRTEGISPIGVSNVLGWHPAGSSE